MRAARGGDFSYPRNQVDGGRAPFRQPCRREYRTACAATRPFPAKGQGRLARFAPKSIGLIKCLKARPELVEGQGWRGISASTSSPRTVMGLLKRITGGGLGPFVVGCPDLAPSCTSCWPADPARFSGHPGCRLEVARVSDQAGFACLLSAVERMGPGGLRAGCRDSVGAVCRQAPWLAEAPLAPVPSPPPGEAVVAAVSVPGRHWGRIAGRMVGEALGGMARAQPHPHARADSPDEVRGWPGHGREELLHARAGFFRAACGSRPPDE